MGLNGFGILILLKIIQRVVDAIVRFIEREQELEKKVNDNEKT